MSYATEHLIKCRDNPIYFIENEFYTSDGYLNLHDYQKQIIEQIHANPRTAMKMSRRAGSTMLMNAYATWLGIMRPAQNIFLMSNNLASSMQSLNQIRFAIELMFYVIADEYEDVRLDLKLEENNKRAIQFSNGSRIMTTSSPSALRGWNIDFIALDDADFYKKDAIEELRMILPASINCKAVSLGGNFGWPTIIVPWHKVPGRDESWKENMIRTYGPEMFDREYPSL